MSWTIEIKPTAVKSYKKLDKQIKQRIKKALNELKDSDNPLKSANTKMLSGKLKGDYRLRIGNYRILFTPDIEEKMLYVYAILSREGAYK